MGIYDDFYEIATDLIEEYGDIYRNDIISSLLNVILVLSGARMACIIDDIRVNEALLKRLLEILLDYYPLSVNRLTSVEYLLFLTINKDQVEKEYNMIRANVLGYCYNKPDFANIFIDRIAVEFWATSRISGFKVDLFITVIPAYAYDDSVKQCISDRIELFNLVLNNLDYTVTVETRHVNPL